MNSKLLIVAFCLLFSELILAQNELTETLKYSPDSAKYIQLGSNNISIDNLSGAATIFNSEDFNREVILAPQKLLTGKVPGLLIYQAGIFPNNFYTTNIRGVASLNGSSEPIYIVDGVPVEGEFLSFLNVDDIENFIVLRDGLSHAIYGAQAANGTILIQTKNPISSKKLHITYHGYVALSSLAKKVDVFSGDELRKIIFDNENNLYSPANMEELGLENTDWQNEIFQNAISYNQHIGFSGGIGILPYRASIGHTNFNGILKNTGLKRTSVSLNLGPSFFNNTLKIKILTFAAFTNNNLGDVGALKSSIDMDPTQVVCDGNELSGGYFQWENYGTNLGTPNPVEQILEADNQYKVTRLINNIEIDYSFPFIKELRINFSYKSIYANFEGHNNRPVTSPSILLVPSSWGQLIDYHKKNESKILGFYLNYSTEIKKLKSKMNISAGLNTQNFKNKGAHYWRNIEDQLHPYQLLDSASYSNSSSLASLYGSISYNFDERYLLSVTARRENSTFFKNENQWSLFPFYSFAWKIKEESFLKDISFINKFKLYFGWGRMAQHTSLNGNYEQASYTPNFSDPYYPFDGINLPPLNPNYYDPDLKPEKISIKNLGLDFGFFQNRIAGSVNIYEKTVDDLIAVVNVAGGSNFTNYLLTNIGKLENRGVEASINIIPISKHDLFLQVGLNFTRNENKMAKLELFENPEYNVIIYGSAFSGQFQITTEGEPIKSFFVNRQIYNNNGAPIEGLYENISGEPGIVAGDPEDKYVYKNPRPDYFFGFSFNLRFNNWELSSSAHANVGNYMYNMVAAGASYDQIKQVGYSKNVPRYLNETKFVKRQYTSDYFVQNASFLNIDDISLSYTFNKKSPEKTTFRIYATAQNPWIFTKYEGSNPEIYDGIDNGTIPRTRTFLLGINVNL